MVADDSMLSRPGTHDQQFDIDFICYVILEKRSVTPISKEQAWNQTGRNRHIISFQLQGIQHTFNGITFLSEPIISSRTSRSVCWV